MFFLPRERVRRSYGVWKNPSTTNSALDYYMGTLLLHQDSQKSTRYIIDGQQRITTLCLLYYILKGILPRNQALTFRSSLSREHIRRAQAHLAQSQLATLATDVFERICFTVISVLSEDLAFTFFDTQNTRGMPLQATDLLKAYHLRAIQGGGDLPLRLQTDCAKRWERMQNSKPIRGPVADFAPTLFQQYLWRARRWTGQKSLARETSEAILAEFQHDSIAATALDTIALYPCRTNQLGAALTFDLPARPLPPRPQEASWDAHAAELPFAIRHPITRGMGFFLYVDKYTALLRQLFDDLSPGPEVGAFRRLYGQVIADLSPYLRELFLLASVMYIDQFGHRHLFHFALWLDYALGAIRIEKHAIFRQAPLIYLRDSSHNLLDVIAGAYRPKAVITYLKHDRHAHGIYDTEKIQNDNGVQGRYKQRVLTYYCRQGSLQGRHSWIPDQLSKELPS